MRENMLPIPVAKIKQEPCEDSISVGSASKMQDVASDERRPDDMMPANGDLDCQSIAGNSDKMTDRSEQMSNGSDSGDIIMREDGSDFCSKDFKYECPICQARFKSARAFRGHGIVHRFGTAPELRTRLPSMDPGQCSMSYSPKRMGFESSSFKCDGCQTVFSSRDTYAMHMLMRAKDENCGGLATDIKHRARLEDGADHLGSSNSQAESAASLRHGLWDFHVLKGRADSKLLDYQPVIPDLIPSPGGSRELIVCRICGELFQNKDSLAMHMMFHTRSEAESSRRGWTVIYASAMSDLAENPDDLIANHELIPIDDPSQESLEDVTHTPHTSEDPSYGEEINEGLDLSIGSRANGIDNSKSDKDDENKETSSWLRGQSFSEDFLYKDIKRSHQDRRRYEGHRGVDSFQYGSSKPLRSQSADGIMSGSTESKNTNDANIIKCLTEDPTRLKISYNHPRPKSADMVMHLNDQYLSSAFFGKVRKLRRSRVPTRKHQHRPSFYMNKAPDARHHQDAFQHQYKNASDKALVHLDTNIRDIIAAKGKDMSYCKYCEIIYADRTLYQLHMGLHNVNNPWQCNACGRICANRLEFSSHVLHY